MKRKIITALCAGLALLNLPLISVAQVETLRPDLMYCGTSSRTGANLYLGVGTFNEVQGCSPDQDTQALLVERAGSIGGNGAAWLAYLNNGGVIISEYFQYP